METNGPPSLTQDCAVAHDLLNELKIIVGVCDLLFEEFLEYRFTRHLHEIRDAAVRMAKFVKGYEIPAGPRGR